MNDTSIRVMESFSKRHDISSQGSVSHLEEWCVHGHCQSALKANLHEHTIPVLSTNLVLREPEGSLRKQQKWRQTF